VPLDVEPFRASASAMALLPDLDTAAA